MLDHKYTIFTQNAIVILYSLAFFVPKENALHDYVSILGYFFLLAVLLGLIHIGMRSYSTSLQTPILKKMAMPYLPGAGFLILSVVGIMIYARINGKWSNLAFDTLRNTTGYGVFLAMLAAGILVIRLLFENGILGSGVSRLSIEESATVIAGMLKSTSKLEIPKIAELTGYDEKFWTTRIFSLLGSGDIAGDFDGNVFTATDDTDIENMIDNLMADFEKMETKKESKI